MIELKTHRMHFSFPDVHLDAKLAVEFQRTLRIPDDGNEHFLPPGLGNFPLRHVDDVRFRMVRKQPGGREATSPVTPTSLPVMAT